MQARVSGTLPATPEGVWESLADPERLREWWPQLTLEPELGGGFLELWSDENGNERRTTGTVTTWTAPELVELDWADEDWEFMTAVSIGLAPTATETRIVISHTGWEAAGSDAAALLDAHETGWQRHLHRWRRYLRPAPGE